MNSLKNDKRAILYITGIEMGNGFMKMGLLSSSFFINESEDDKMWNHKTWLDRRFALDTADTLPLFYEIPILPDTYVYLLLTVL